jgi:hypothetical protein
MEILVLGLLQSPLANRCRSQTRNLLHSRRDRILDPVCFILFVSVEPAEKFVLTFASGETRRVGCH